MSGIAAEQQTLLAAEPLLLSLPRVLTSAGGCIRYDQFAQPSYHHCLGIHELIPPLSPGSKEEPDESALLLDWVHINQGAAGQVALVGLGGHLTQLACIQGRRRRRRSREVMNEHNTTLSSSIHRRRTSDGHIQNKALPSKL
jgi:hypothetical protein